MGETPKMPKDDPKKPRDCPESAPRGYNVWTTGNWTICSQMKSGACGRGACLQVMIMTMMMTLIIVDSSCWLLSGQLDRADIRAGRISMVQTYLVSFVTG